MATKYILSHTTIDESKYYNSYSNETADMINKYLKNYPNAHGDITQPLRRGDIVQVLFQHNIYNDEVLTYDEELYMYIYDGKKIVSLDYMSTSPNEYVSIGESYGQIPREFAYPEFSFRYWEHILKHNYSYYINVNYTKNIIDHLMYVKLSNLTSIRPKLFSTFSMTSNSAWCSFIPDSDELCKHIVYFYDPVNRRFYDTESDRNKIVKKLTDNTANIRVNLVNKDGNVLLVPIK